MMEIPKKVKEMNVTESNKWARSNGVKLIYVPEKGRTMAVRIH